MGWLPDSQRLTRGPSRAMPSSRIRRTNSVRLMSPVAVENSRQVASSQASRLVLSIFAESRGYGSIGSRCGRPR